VENPSSIQNGIKLPVNIMIPKPLIERANINNNAINQFETLKLAIFLVLL